MQRSYPNSRYSVNSTNVQDAYNANSTKAQDVNSNRVQELAMVEEVRPSSTCWTCSDAGKDVKHPWQNVKFAQDAYLAMKKLMDGRGKGKGNDKGKGKGASKGGKIDPPVPHQGVGGAPAPKRA